MSIKNGEEFARRCKEIYPAEFELIMENICYIKRSFLDLGINFYNKKSNISAI